MRKTLIVASTIFLTSCGGLQLWKNENSVKPRKLASLNTNEKVLNEEIDKKLLELHHYYLMGQKHLNDFDAQIGKSSVSKLYTSRSYSKLIAVRILVEKIEHEVMELNEYKKDFVGFSIENKITIFAGQSLQKSLSMENLKERLNISSDVQDDKSSSFQAEYDKEKISNEFTSLEKNVDHLSHDLMFKMAGSDPVFQPSENKNGNITGNEFPSKVWALTFDDGPNNTTTPKILSALKDRGLKATFFQLTSMAKSHPEITKKLNEAGMEIASHSYTHKKLTAVDESTLEKEITGAIEDLERIQGQKVKFFRLPYGAGVNNLNIRKKIKANGKIHVFWNIDTLDWMPQRPSQIVSRAISMMKKIKHDSGVVLFHDIHERTTQASPLIMDFLKQGNRRVCTLSEIVDQMNAGDKTICPKN